MNPRTKLFSSDRVLHTQFHTHHSAHAGLRARFVNDSMGLETYLLGLRPFTPAPELNNEIDHVSDMLKLWADAVLDEFGLSLDNVFAVTSDSGSDVKRCARVSMDKPWEWCAPHLFNRALVEAMGHTEARAESRNPAGREVIMALNQIISHVKKSPKVAVRVFYMCRVMSCCIFIRVCLPT